MVDGRRRTIDDRRLTVDEGRRTKDESEPLYAGASPSSVVYRPSSVLRPSSSFVLRLSSVVVLLILLSTLAYAFAFSGIYRRPFTRAAASRWVYQNVPGPINLRIQTEDGVYNQPLPYPAASTIHPDQPFITSFQAYASGALGRISGACGQ